MNAPALASPTMAFGALALLEYLNDLLTATPKESFTREEILVLLNLVRDDPEVFDPDVVAAFQQMSEAD